MNSYLELVLFVVLWLSGLVVAVVGIVRAAFRPDDLWGDARMGAVDVELDELERRARTARSLPAGLIEVDLDWGWPR